LDTRLEETNREKKIQDSVRQGGVLRRNFGLCREKILPIFDGDEILQFFYRNLLEVCREKIVVSFRVPRAKKFENHWI
jgi:hypothetical protein